MGTLLSESLNMNSSVKNIVGADRISKTCVSEDSTLTILQLPIAAILDEK